MRLCVFRRCGKWRYKLKLVFVGLCIVTVINICQNTAAFWRDSLHVRHEVYNIRQTLVTLPVEWEPKLHKRKSENLLEDMERADSSVHSVILPEESSDRSAKGPRTGNGGVKMTLKPSLPTLQSIQKDDCHNWTQFQRPVRDQWGPVDHNRTAYIFSAFEDPFTPNHVTIIGAALTRSRHLYFCQVWSTTKDSSHQPILSTNKATLIHFAEGHEKRYNAVKFLCSTPVNVTLVSVSLTTSECGQPLHVLEPRAAKIPPVKRKFTVCVTPLSFKYGRAYELVEWIELNQILGADKIVLYNYSTSPNVDRVLKKYTEQGIVDVIQWRLPVLVNTWPQTQNNVEIHYFGQMASMNDCFLRYALETEYIVNEDLDEFIVPVREEDTSWSDVIIRYKDMDAFLFQNVFFRKEWNDTGIKFERREEAEKYRLVTLLKTLHEQKLWRPSQRSKYIFRPRAGLVLGIHDLRLPDQMRRKVHVSSQYGMLHHYRNWENYEVPDRQIESRLILDKYKDRLIDRVSSTWSELPGVQLNMPYISEK